MKAQEGPTGGRKLAGSRSSSRARPIAPQPDHRHADAWAIGLVALGIVLLVALAAGNAGLVGDGLANSFRAVLGRGAWAAPFALFLAAIGLMLGRSSLELGKTLWGSFASYVGMLGLLAVTVDGDFFDPEAVSRGGGYAGACIGWAFEKLLGRVSWVGLTALVLAGLVFAIGVPLRTILHGIARSTPLPRRKPRPLELDDEDDAVEPTRKPKPPKTARPALGPETAEPMQAETARPAKRIVAQDHKDVHEVVLDTDAGMPREGYTLPPLSLLQTPEVRAKRSPQETQKNIETLEATLQQFNIEASVVQVATGPSVTRYEVQLGPGVLVGRVKSLADNIAMNLAASQVRVEAPIPGKDAIGVEVPNRVRTMVTLRELCESLEFHDQKARLLTALGRDVSGVPQYTDLTRMPHLLIGGATNSGKSICLASIIMSLILRGTPKDLRLVLIDPKRVELSFFEGLPHLMCPVVKDVKEAPGVLRAVTREMNRRYQLFSDGNVRNIEGWNERNSFQDKLPYIVVVIDELADLMIQASAEVETEICRLAQLARATGIHLVIATQRPSVDVITGTIKANIASRVAFAVSSQVDSRTILDMAGAERLIGRGDMLFLPIDESKPVRIQGCYVAENEIESVVHHWRSQEKPHYVLTPIEAVVADREADMRDEESDPLWEESVRWIVGRGQASTSMLQRRFKIGFQRASRLLDLMEERAIVGARDGPRPREVLLDPSELESMFGSPFAELRPGDYLDD